MAERLKDVYMNEVVPKLMEQFNYNNKHEVPRIEKIVINRGIGEASQNTKIADFSLQELTMITGQKGIVTRSKKSIAGLIALLAFSEIAFSSSEYDKRESFESMIILLFSGKNNVISGRKEFPLGPFPDSLFTLNSPIPPLSLMRCRPAVSKIVSKTVSPISPTFVPP